MQTFHRTPGRQLWSRATLLFLALALALLGPWWAFPDGGAPAALSAEAAQAAREQASALVRLLVDTPDPLKPDDAARKVLQSVVQALGGSDPVLVFNGKVYPKVLVVGVVDEGDPEAYFLKPDDKAIPRADYLPLVQKREFAAEQALAGLDPVHRETVELFLQGTPTAAQVEAVLAARKADGTITGADWLPSSRRLLYTLKGEEEATELYPALEAEALRYVARAYGEPRKYAEGTLLETRRRMASGEALVVNTRQKPAVQVFLPRTVLREDLEILADPSLTPDQKLERYSRGLKLGRADRPEGPALAFAGHPAWAAPASTARELLDRPGVIVPPSKRIGYLRGPDYIINRQFHSQVRGGGDPTGVATLKNREGPLACYHENGYTLEVTTAEWDRPFVETLDRVFRDDDISILYFHTHGDLEDGTGVLLAELYDIGRSAKPGSKDYVALTPAENDEFTRNARAFRSRVAALKARYPGEQITSMNVRSRFRPEGAGLMRSFEAGLPDRIRDAMDPNKRRSMGAILVTSGFVAKAFEKARKSVVMLQACHSGAVAPSIRARVVLAPTVEDMTSESTFLDSDLRKIGAYLFKRPDPGPVAVTPENMRNYDVVRDFRAPPAYHGLPTEDAIFDAEAKVAAEPGRLASIRLYGTQGQTVTPSPHVVEAGPDRVVFSAPMDTSVPASEVVQLEGGAGGKPEWVSDREIKLPWKGSRYRAWQASDLDGQGRPTVAYVRLTVRHASARSAVSRVELTGNPDCADADGCKVREGWTRPTETRYNANRPRTDFVFFQPRIGGDEPPPVVHVASGDLVQHVLSVPRTETDSSSNLDLDGSRVIDHDATKKQHDACRDYPNPYPIYYFGGDMATFGSHYAYDRSAYWRDPTKQQESELFLDGGSVFRSPDGGGGRIAEVQLYGDRLAYVVNESTPSGAVAVHSLFVDGRKQDYGLGDLFQMSTTSVLTYGDRGLRLDGTLFAPALPNEGYSWRSPARPGAAGGGKQIFFARDRVLFRDQAGHVLLHQAGSGTRDLGPGDAHMMFGEHVVFTRRATLVAGPSKRDCEEVVYDGKSLGAGEHPVLHGDHVAFLTDSNPKTRQGSLYARRQAELDAWDQPPFSSNQRLLFLDGNYIDMGKKLALPKATRPNEHYRAYNMALFGTHVAFVLEHVWHDGQDRSERRMIHDWKDLGPCVGPPPVLFEDHIAFLRKVGETEHVIYDGRDLGEGQDPVLYGDHIAWHGMDGNMHFDGKTYPEAMSAYDNVEEAHRYHLEVLVPSSPYGSVKFDLAPKGGAGK